MGQWERLKVIFKLASPIMIGMLTVNLMTLIDTMMVGSLGTAALAGVGLGGFLNALMGAIFQGIAAGVQSMVSRRLGEDRLDLTWVVLLAGLGVALLFGIPIALLANHYAPLIFKYMINDPEVWAQGVPYFRILSFSLVIQAMNYMFRGFWNGRHRPNVYMSALIMLFFVNAGLNYIFIFGHFGVPAMGSAGAGLGTALAMTLIQIYYWVFTLPQFRREGGQFVLPGKDLIVRLIKVGLPTSFQEFSTMLCFSIFLRLLGALGTLEVAIATVIVRLLTVGYLPAIGLGMAVTSLVGRSLGQKDPEGAARWGWEVCAIGFVCLTFAGVLASFFAPQILSVFLHEDHALSVARLPFMIAASIFGIPGVGVIFTYALVGAGATKSAMSFNFMQQWLLLLPTTYLGIQSGLRLPGVFLTQVGTQLVLTLCLMWVWKAGKWKRSLV